MAQQRRSQQDPLLVTGSADGLAAAWDIDYPQPMMNADVCNRGGAARSVVRINSVGVSPSGAFAAFAMEDGNVIVAGAILFSHQLHGSSSKYWCCVDVSAKLQIVAVSRAHSSGCRSVAWSPDERQLVSSSIDGSVCVWNFYP